MQKLVKVRLQYSEELGIITLDTLKGSDWLELTIGKEDQREGAKSIYDFLLRMYKLHYD